MKLYILMIVMVINQFIEKGKEPVDNSSLSFFRIVFGLLMFASTIRFILKGWIKQLYLDPGFHFTYYGFEWVKVWPEWGLYLHFYLLALFSLLVAAGLFYRISIIMFFLAFTYIELLDKTYYLNHYYAISLISFLMIFLPLNRNFSLDCLIKPGIKSEYSARWVLWVLQFQIGLIYFFAGVAKLKTDWIFEAQPLRIWLSASTNIPVIGPFFDYKITAYLMSWAGALYDLSIAFFLRWKRTRALAYLSVIVFHSLTGILFSIGMFPWIMMLMALIFFSPEWPKKLLKKFLPESKKTDLPAAFSMPGALTALFTLFFSIQLLLPFRYLAYPGNVCWHEQGFRFSWNVMLIEKTGMAEFTVRDGDNREWVVNNHQYLSPLQIKMMSTQPDMILQFAHYIGKKYQEKGLRDISVFAEVYVALNGKMSKLLINPQKDLLKYEITLKNQEFILNY